MKKAPFLRLFNNSFKGLLNKFGKPIAGWIPGTAPYTIVNPMGYGLAWVVVHDEDGNPLYNQPVVLETPGAIVICVLGDRIGLIPSYRMVGERIIPNGGDYVKIINDEGLWGNLISGMGKSVWEAPRGLITEEVKENLEEFVVKTAKMEALQEAGYKITNAKIMGKVNANTTFFFHAQYVVYAEIESVGNANPEDMELIGKAKLFTIEEIAELQRNGEFEDGLTLAAMALCGISMPIKN